MEWLFYRQKGSQLALIGVMTLIEFARWRFPFGGVPLATIPIGQASGPIAPVAKVAGPLLIVAITTAAGCFISSIIRTPKKAVKTLIFTAVTSSWSRDDYH